VSIHSFTCAYRLQGGSVGVKIGGGRGALKPFIPDDSCGDDIFEGALEDERSPQLPYLTQDLWGCEREKKDIDTIVLENDELKVTQTSLDSPTQILTHPFSRLLLLHNTLVKYGAFGIKSAKENYYLPIEHINQRISVL